MRTRRAALKLWIPAGLAALAVSGCHNEVEDVNPPAPVHYPPVGTTQTTAVAGVPVQNPGPASLVTALIQSYQPHSRIDPWALTREEISFEAKERNARVFATTGNYFPAVFVPQVERTTIVTQEPQPYRRLAGVLVGESVMAIIDMGDGRPMELIRPGMQIPNSPWRVISIDEEKAVLRRSGNKLPKEIVVRLETPAFAPGTIAPGEQPGNNLPTNQPGGGAPAGGGRRGGKGAGAGGAGGGSGE